MGSSRQTDSGHHILSSDTQKIKKLLNGFYKSVQKKRCFDITNAHQIYVSRLEQRLNFAKSYLGYNKKEEFEKELKEAGYELLDFFEHPVSSRTVWLAFFVKV